MHAGRAAFAVLLAGLLSGAPEARAASVPVPPGQAKTKKVHRPIHRRVPTSPSTSVIRNGVIWHGHYFPSAGVKPGYGRVEVDPVPNAPPQVPETYRRSWSTQSTTRLPVTVYPPFKAPDVNIELAPPRAVKKKR